jgi:hypothetical protein
MLDALNSIASSTESGPLKRRSLSNAINEATFGVSGIPRCDAESKIRTGLCALVINDEASLLKDFIKSCFPVNFEELEANQQPDKGIDVQAFVKNTAVLGFINDLADRPSKIEDTVTYLNGIVNSQNIPEKKAAVIEFLQALTDKLEKMYTKKTDLGITSLIVTKFKESNNISDSLKVYLSDSMSTMANDRIESKLTELVGECLLGFTGSSTGLRSEVRRGVVEKLDDLFKIEEIENKVELVESFLEKLAVKWKEEGGLNLLGTLLQSESGASVDVKIKQVIVLKLTTNKNTNISDSLKELFENSINLEVAFYNRFKSNHSNEFGHVLNSRLKDKDDALTQFSVVISTIDKVCGSSAADIIKDLQTNYTGDMKPGLKMMLLPLTYLEEAVVPVMVRGVLRSEAPDFQKEMDVFFKIVDKDSSLTKVEVALKFVEMVAAFKATSAIDSRASEIAVAVLTNFNENCNPLNINDIVDIVNHCAVALIKADVFSNLTTEDVSKRIIKALPVNNLSETQPLYGPLKKLQSFFSDSKDIPFPRMLLSLGLPKKGGELERFLKADPKNREKFENKDFRNSINCFGSD